MSDDTPTARTFETPLPGGGTMVVSVQASPGAQITGLTDSMGHTYTEVPPEPLLPEEVALRKALEALKPECRKPWVQLDKLPYLHATDDPNAKAYHAPVVGRFDYLETMAYIQACNPQAIQRLLDELEALRQECN